MSTIRAGNRAALLVVDAQVGVVADAWEAPRVIANIARAVDRAREHQVPVVWVQHDSDELPRDSAAWQLAPPLQARDGEARIGKRFNSAFEQTGLDDELARIGASHLVLAGAETNWCIRATAYGAIERGYDLTLVKDGHTALPIDLGDGAKTDVAAIVKDLNIVMNWVSYPGRKCGTASAAELDFAGRW